MIKQTLHFTAPPDAVYNALMDEVIHARFTGAAAKIENKIGGKFSVWDGYASGTTLELVPKKKLFRNGKHRTGRKDLYRR